MPLGPTETTIPRPILGYKDEECEIAWLTHDGNIAFTELPPDVYREVKEKKFVDEVVTKQ